MSSDTTGRHKRKLTFPALQSSKSTIHIWGCVDLLDCLVSLYKFQLKSRRWYMYIFYHSFYDRSHILAIVPPPLHPSEGKANETLKLPRPDCLRTCEFPPPSNGSPPPVPAVRTAAEHAPTTKVRLDMVGIYQSGGHACDAKCLSALQNHQSSAQNAMSTFA